MKKITCARDCDPTAEFCPTPAVCSQPREVSDYRTSMLAEYQVRVVRPWVAPLTYTTRAANSVDVATQAMELHGLGCGITVRKVGP